MSSIDYAALAKQHGALKSIPPVDPNDFTAQYNTPLNPTQQKAFDKWADQQKAKTGKDPRGDKYDYDVNGYFLSGAATDERGHGTDQFKKPNHPTFSNESIYHGVDGHFGGQWIPSGTTSVYQASPTNMKFRSPGELRQYFSEVEPDAMVTTPATTPVLPPALR